MSGRQIEIQIDEDGTRLDKFLADRLSELSRSAVQRLIDSGEITVNGELVRASYKVRSGDRVLALLPEEEPTELVAEAVPLNIVYEDEFLLVVDKPAGMVVHPAPGHPRGTLLNALLSYAPELAASQDDRPGIVHRLDRDTSGLILIAKRNKIRKSGI